MSVSAEVQRERDDAAGVEGVVLVREVITGSSVMVCVCVCVCDVCAGSRASFSSVDIETII